MSEQKKYEVTVKEKKGSCDNDLFDLMVKNGDITSTKVSQLIGAILKIEGYSKCHIETDKKSFDINYIDTEEYGLISSGSEIFMKSVETYFGKVEYFRLAEVKTSKGTTYKAVPMLNTTKKEEPKQKEEATNDDLPFNL